MYDPKRGYPAAVPYVLYRDPAAAARWLVEVLGFREAIRFTVPGGGAGRSRRARARRRSPHTRLDRRSVRRDFVDHPGVRR